jgi:RNA methyltransferase, TrmH family
MVSTHTERLREISGRHNAVLKELRRAFAHGELTEDGECAIEGLRIVEEAIRSGLRFRAVFFSESGKRLTERLMPQLKANVETLVLPDKLFASAVPSETPQGVAALVRVKQFKLQDVLGGGQTDGRPALVVGVVGIQDPGNLGTLLRSAEAFDATGVVLGEKTVSAYNSKVVRASAGSLFRIPMVRTKSTEVVSQLRERGIRLLATSSHQGTPLYEARLAEPLAIFIGSEAAGVPREVLSMVDEVIAIPHSSKVESLNAGVAASIVLYEAARQRQSLERA